MTDWKCDCGQINFGGRHACSACGTLAPAWVKNNPRFVVGDAFGVDLPAKYFGLVYADPPYAGCRARYARGNKSRQWGRDARADFLRDLIARMEYLRAPDGVCAVSMGTPELRLLSLFPSRCRVAAWVKPNSSPRPSVWPAFAWEPLVIWGKLPSGSYGRRPPNDWTELSAAPSRKLRAIHETPKPEGFAQWVFDLTLDGRRDPVCELFAGTAPIARLGAERGAESVAVDLTHYDLGGAA